MMFLAPIARIGRASVLILAGCGVAGCAMLPQGKATRAHLAPPPALVPLDSILQQADAVGSGEAAVGSVAARADRLRGRADRLRDQ